MNIFANALRIFSLVALAALGACSGAFSQVHSRFHQLIPVVGAPMVNVDNVAGEIRVSTWNKPSVNIEATKYAGDAAQLRSVTITTRSGVNEVFIATKYAGGTHEGGVNYTISVPANVALSIKNIAGTVNVSGLRANVSVKTQAGTISANLGRVTGNHAIDLSATTGTVDLTIASNSDASVDVQSSVGSFSSEFPSVAKTRSNVVGVTASGKIGTGTATIHLTSSIGAITLNKE